MARLWLDDRLNRPSLGKDESREAECRQHEADDDDRMGPAERLRAELQRNDERAERDDRRQRAPPVDVRLAGAGHADLTVR